LSGAAPVFAQAVTGGELQAEIAGNTLTASTTPA